MSQATSCFGGGDAARWGGGTYDGGSCKARCAYREGRRLKHFSFDFVLPARVGRNRMSHLLLLFLLANTAHEAPHCCKMRWWQRWGKGWATHPSFSYSFKL
jgi:hypothetical protein